MIADSLPFATPLDLMRAPAAEYDAAGDQRMIRRLGLVAWAIATALAAVMALAWAPDSQFGQGGWVLAGTLLAANGMIAARVLSEKGFTLWGALGVSLGVMSTLGSLQWLAGGSGQYTAVTVLPLVFVAASQAPKRVLMALGVAVFSLLPALVELHFASTAVAQDLVYVVIWVCLAGLGLFWTAGVRWQRLALRHSEDHARTLASHDPVTGLGNRRKLVVDLDEAIAAGGELELALFDLNGFKSYNDTFGHPAGDALLARLGAKLGQAADGYGSAYRMGGDEFVLLTTRPGAVGDLVAAGRAALSETGHGFHITAAGGIVSLPREAAVATDALRLADQRMYAEKYRGRASSPRHGTSMLMAVLNERYPQLGEHTDGVTALAVAVGSHLGLTAVQLEELQQASQLHDIGKLAIPDAILEKAGPLTDQEWEFIRRHTLVGERILESSPSLAAVGRIVRSSHERYDGTGYPDQLAAEQIPLAARIVAVCDAYEAMTSDRAYRKGASSADAIAELRGCAGTQFDPRVVEIFIRALHEPAVGRSYKALTDGADAPVAAIPLAAGTRQTV